MGPWPAELADLTDNEVIERARHFQHQLRIAPREHPGNDRLITEWGAVCRELNRRGMTDVVTEGSAPGSVIFGQFGAE